MAHSTDSPHFDSGSPPILDELAKRPLLIIGPILGLIVVAAIIVFFLNQRQEKSQAANNALFQAQSALETELKAFANSVAAPPAEAQPGKKPAAPNPDEVLYRKVDVDSKFPDSLKKLEAVIDQYPGTRAAFEAELSVGGLYANHGQPAKAIAWFEKAAATAPKPYDDALALSLLGSAQEGAGKYADAIQSYQKSMNLGQAGLKADLLLGIARDYALMGDKDHARSTYDELISQMPESEQARSAALLKARL